MAGLTRSGLSWNWARGLSAVVSLKHAESAGGSNAPGVDLVSLSSPPESNVAVGWQQDRLGRKGLSQHLVLGVEV